MEEPKDQSVVYVLVFKLGKKVHKHATFSEL